MSNYQYDFDIVGAGLFGSTCARLLTDAGYKVKVYESRMHIAGNCYTENMEGIEVHKYGAHIFHTNDPEIWAFVNRFASFNNYIHIVFARNAGKMIPLPFNLSTFAAVSGIYSPEFIKAWLKSDGAIDTGKYANMEDWAIQHIGRTMYDLVVKDYTTKQWGLHPKDMPVKVLKRLPVRFTYDYRYFDDAYQGIPVNGYTDMVAKMLAGIEVQTNCNWSQYIRTGKRVIYSGSIDTFYGYRLGLLEYRSLDFLNNHFENQNYQGCAVVNHTGSDTDYTRTIEHKHFMYGKQTNTIVTHEYPANWNISRERYYPIENEKNLALYSEYKKLASEDPDIVFGGRLGRYRYYDMHQVIANAMDVVKKIRNTQLNS